VEANVVLKNLMYWVALGLANFAGVVVVVYMVQHKGQPDSSEMVPSYALVMLVGAFDLLAAYIVLSRRAT